MNAHLIAGSRQSPLALTQTQLVIEALLSLHGQMMVTLKPFKTQGDVMLDTALSQVGGKGLFVKELEMALLDGQIDFAVHSMKDMPAEVPYGLKVFSVLHRRYPLDALVSRNPRHDIDDLPEGAKIGTSSLRRQAMIKRLRPDVEVHMVRGNLQTRLQKLDEGQFDAIVLAEAGLRRMGLAQRISQVFGPSLLLPACCQGTLAVEVRDDQLLPLFDPLVNLDTEICTRAERAFMQTINGGCQVPMAAFAEPDNTGQYRMTGLICSPDGTQFIEERVQFWQGDAERAGSHLARSLLDKGGADILAALQETPPVEGFAH